MYWAELNRFTSDIHHFIDPTFCVTVTIHQLFCVLSSWCPLVFSLASFILYEVKVENLDSLKHCELYFDMLPAPWHQFSWCQNRSFGGVRLLAFRTNNCSSFNILDSCAQCWITRLVKLRRANCCSSSRETLHRQLGCHQFNYQALREFFFNKYSLTWEE